jgi:hypothetical protein
MLSHTQVFQWHARFKTSRTSVDGEHTGRPTSCTTPETIAWIQELIHQDRRQTIHDIAWELIVGHANGFWQKNWACMSQPNLCPIAWQLTRSSSESMCALNFVSLPPTMKLPWFDTLWLLPISKNEIETERMPVWYHWGDQGWIADSAWHSGR